VAVDAVSSLAHAAEDHVVPDAHVLLSASDHHPEPAAGALAPDTGGAGAENHDLAGVVSGAVGCGERVAAGSGQGLRQARGPPGTIDAAVRRRIAKIVD